VRGHGQKSRKDAYEVAGGRHQQCPLHAGLEIVRHDATAMLDGIEEEAQRGRKPISGPAAGRSEVRAPGRTWRRSAPPGTPCPGSARPPRRLPSGGHRDLATRRAADRPRGTGRCAPRARPSASALACASAWRAPSVAKDLADLDVEIRPPRTEQIALRLHPACGARPNGQVARRLADQPDSVQFGRADCRGRRRLEWREHDA
jgi:hypothetical protein